MYIHHISFNVFSVNKYKLVIFLVTPLIFLGKKVPIFQAKRFPFLFIFRKKIKCNSRKFLGKNQTETWLKNEDGSKPNKYLPRYPLPPPAAQTTQEFPLYCRRLYFFMSLLLSTIFELITLKPQKLKIKKKKRFLWTKNLKLHHQFLKFHSPELICLLIRKRLTPPSLWVFCFFFFYSTDHVFSCDFIFDSVLRFCFFATRVIDFF